MLKIVKIQFFIFAVLTAMSFVGCGSGEYDVDQYQLNYTEKTVKVDTLKKITINENDQIKEDKKETVQKDVYTYVVQIGAFVNQPNFERFYEQAKQVLGDGVFYEQSNNLYKVRIGNYGNRADAIKYLEIVKSKGYLDAFIYNKKN